VLLSLSAMRRPYAIYRPATHRTTVQPGSWSAIPSHTHGKRGPIAHHALAGFPEGLSYAGGLMMNAIVSSPAAGEPDPSGIYTTLCFWSPVMACVG
jgi:hypothetical protein